MTIKLPTVITLMGLLVGGAVGGVVYVENGDSGVETRAKAYTTDELKKTDRYYQMQFDTMKEQIDDIEETTKDIHRILVERYDPK